MSKQKADVTVIGAGPAGSTAARANARHGFELILVEKDEYPGKTNVFFQLLYLTYQDLINATQCYWHPKVQFLIHWYA